MFPIINTYFLGANVEIVAWIFLARGKNAIAAVSWIGAKRLCPVKLCNRIWLMRIILSVLHSTQASDLFAWRNGVCEWLHGLIKRAINSDTSNWLVKKGELLLIWLL